MIINLFLRIGIWCRGALSAAPEKLNEKINQNQETKKENEEDLDFI